MSSISQSTLRGRLLGKVRRACLRAPLVRHWADWSYYAALGRHMEQLRCTAHYPPEVLATLRRERIVRLDGASVLPADVVHAARELCRDLERNRASRTSFESSHHEIPEMVQVHAWGLWEPNIDLAEAYIGLPVHYLGASVKRERVDGSSEGVRQWHIDVEDRRMLKFIVYLGEVSEDAGPLEYLEREPTEEARSKLRYWTGFVDDQRMHTAVGRERWRSVTGPALTMTMLDTCRLFHRARPPLVRDRYSLTFSFCSRLAWQIFPEYLPSRGMVAKLAHQLTPRQREASIHA